MSRLLDNPNGHRRDEGAATSRMELPTAELLMRGRELIRYLRRYGESTWAEWLEDALEIVRRDARSGVLVVLEGFEGMGALTDVYLCPEAGHRLAASDENAVNEELLIRVARVYQLTRELGDFVDADSFRRQMRLRR
ncbi:MAG: hypothetical protein HKN81_05185 [Gammaproteobacteria bacterium]|nr:hypothetical protein [Gammaproteobacteria bacterium]